MKMIELNQVVKEYPKVRAVDGISLTIQEGEIYGLLGPNGAGKSTTIGMIATLIEPTAGEIFIKGMPLKREAGQIKKLIGLVPQEIALYPTLTAKENLEFWGKMYGLKGSQLKEKVAAILDLVGLSHRKNERIENYSGGMKRRINIAVGLLHQPEILIMDEPTVGVDPQSRTHILETIKNLNQQGMTVIYTSHYMEEVEFLCDRIGIMDHGKLIAEGTKDQLTQLIGSYNTIKVKTKETDDALFSDLLQIPGVHDVALTEEQLEILTPEDETLLPDLIQILHSRGNRIEAIQISEPDLESVFLHLTGRALRD